MDDATLTGLAPDEQEDLFTFQQRSFPVLWAWSLGSMVPGWLWRRAGPGFWRGIGAQFLGWGLVAGLIAWFGLSTALLTYHEISGGHDLMADGVHQNGQVFYRVVNPLEGIR